ncbi:hypothetical protein GE061_011487 [Apolygus lucorum]|uniref:Aminopeptidase n=1 Tax=Apolygus lucorum TaxID=248454 RepID=A0A8S9Y1M5_APOLU|nr:hypothetical protein GE061_011487 [Apolygus lucorum]
MAAVVAGNTPWETNPLLPKDVTPLHYDIFLNPDIEKGEFTGRLNITLNVTSSKDHIILHSKLLNITSSQVFATDGTFVPVKCSFEYAPNEFWVVVLSHAINPGKYSLRLDFNGSMVGSLVGLYRSSYTKKDGTISHIATTKFEPTYARRAFPCFDEPSFKATYSTKLVRPAKGYIALSNMNQISEEEDYPMKGQVTVKFADTPLMSTYLACFIICDFPHLPPVTVENSGTPITVYAREGQLENAKHALKTAVDVLGYFNDYFEMQYPLPKLDLIAVPDFVSGAMENWGLVTFRESRMLASTKTSSASDLLSTGNVVAHELAHMWFGDIVTMGWWDDLWLNEGFATFLANAVQDKLMSSFPAQPSFALQYLQNVMVDDAAVSSHPIIRPVSKPDQITEAFDSISYQKGSSVLRMIEDFDAEGFRKAVVRYLDAYKYKNANTSDLWAELSVEYKSVKDISKMLDTWTKQMGFPLVQVERKGSAIELKQIRCLNNVNVKYDKSSSRFGYKWDIPVKYITSNNKTNPKSLVMKMEEEVVSEAIPEGVRWFKLNADQVGYYRVNYTESEWENLKNVLIENPSEMSDIDRANLIDDSFALAKAGYVNYKVPLHLISYFKNGKEKDWAPWDTLNKYFSQLRDLLYQSSDASKQLKSYIRNLVTPYLSDDMWNITADDPPKERFVKAAMVNLACKVGVEECLMKANKLFNQFILNGTKPPIDIRSTVLVFGIEGPKLKENWNELWKLYLMEEDPQEKETLQLALFSVKDAEIIHKLLEYAKNESYIRSQDYFSVVFGMSRTPEGNAIIWDWTRQNWDYLIERFTLNHRQFGLLLPTISRKFFTEQRLQELTSFIEKHPEAGAGAAGRRKALEITKANILLYNDYQPVIKDILKQLVA